MTENPVRYFVGLDLGQAADYTALAAVERRVPTREVEEVVQVTANRRETRRRTEALPAAYHGRHLERLTLGTTYPAVVARVRALLATPELAGRTTLVVDATGVGRPVLDMLRQQGLAPVGVTITGGDAVTYDRGTTRVPKRDLVGAVQVLLQAERLKFAAGLPEVPTMVQELLAFRVKITEAAHDTYGAWREGLHDDLVLAVAVACWYGERPTPAVKHSFVRGSRVIGGVDWGG